MIRSFVFSKGRLLSQDLTLDVLRMVLYEEDVQIWVDVEQPTEEETKGLLEGVFNFHPLAIEDCIAISDDPKADDYEQYLFLVLHAVESASDGFRPTELNLFIGKNYLVTYHQRPLRSVASTIERVMKNPLAVARAPDRLTYTLLDFFLDEYQPALDRFSADINELEQTALQGPTADFLEKILRHKKEVQRLKQIVAPQHEVLARIGRGEFRIIRANLLPYYRDLLDRLVRINNLADTCHNSLINTLQVYLSVQQSQVNHVIKVLTVLATLALPIIAISSFYGMNLNHFPGLGPTGWTWPAAYAWVFGITGATTLWIYLVLKKNKWL